MMATNQHLSATWGIDNFRVGFEKAPKLNKLDLLDKETKTAMDNYPNGKKIQGTIVHVNNCPHVLFLLYTPEDEVDVPTLECIKQ